MYYLLNTRTDWNEPPRARHQLARSLSKKYKVIFISINNIGIPKMKISNPEKNITLISPSWWLPGKINMRIPIINELYQRWLFRKLSKQYRNYNIINFDLSANLDKFFDKHMFFCVDDFLSVKRSKSIFVSMYWKYKQKKTIQSSLFCTGVSKYLHQYLLSYNVNSYLLLTGASEMSGKKTYQKNNEINNIVYVGWLSKLNLSWIKALSKYKKYKIYLVGPVPKNSFLDLNDNIILTGELKGEELDKILLKADVCISPYIKDRDTDKVYTMTNKFWLYLSYGKPIVTCVINNLIDLQDGFIYQSENKSEFIKNIDKAYNEDSFDLFKRRIDFSKNNSWDKRSEELISLFNNFIEQ